jgi:hypothetical protein
MLMLPLSFVPPACRYVPWYAAQQNPNFTLPTGAGGKLLLPDGTAITPSEWGLGWGANVRRMGPAGGGWQS